MPDDAQENHPRKSLISESGMNSSAQHPNPNSFSSALEVEF